MLKRELKVLKYVKRHPDVTRKVLYEKFPFLKDDYHYVQQHLAAEGEEPIFYNGLETGEYQLTDNSTYRLSHEGEQFFKDKSDKFWSFILPYGITTFIALISAAPTIYKIFKFIYNLFVKGTP